MSANCNVHVIYISSHFMQLFPKQTFLVLYYNFVPLSHALSGKFCLYFT